jgi:outer membrane protein TolC
MISSGSASLVDQIRLEMEFAEMENTLAVLKDKRNVHQVAFNGLLNSEEGFQVKLPKVLWDTELDLSKPSLLDSIRLNNRRLKALDHLIAAYHSKTREAKLSGLPAFSVGADYFVTSRSDNPMLDEQANGSDAIVFPRIGITLPLYRKKYTAMMREAERLHESAEYMKASEQNDLRTLFEKTYADYLDAKRRISLYSKLKGFAVQARKILESEYATGSKNFEELLRMEKRWLTHSISLEKARSDKQAAIAFMHFLMGI